MGKRVLKDPITRQTVTFQVTGEETGGELLKAEVRLGIGGRVPKHVHLRLDERVQVISGGILVRVGSSEYQLGPGDIVDVPRRRAHLVRNAGDGEAIFLLEVRPARRMEIMMRALFRLMGSLSPVLKRR